MTVHCGQTVGRTKTKLGTQVGLGPGYIVLDGDPAPPPPKGHSPPIFGPYLLRLNGCMDQGVTWYGGRPRPRRLCIRWVPRSPSQNVGPCLLRLNGWMDEDDTYMEVGLGPGHIVLDGDPAAPKKGAQQFHVSAHVHCGQTVAHFSNC